MVQSLVTDLPMPGSAKPIIGEKYSQAMASIQSATRQWYTSVKPPATHSTAEMLSQPNMRR